MEENSEIRKAMKHLPPEPFQIEGEYLDDEVDGVIYPLRKAMTVNNINLDDTLEPDKLAGKFKDYPHPHQAQVRT